ncbi:MAG: hypothetical protein WB368_14730, partial [Candidatus Sulfotelmatobacter sp.]
IKSSTYKTLQECLKLKPEWKILQTDALTSNDNPALRNHWGSQGLRYTVAGVATKAAVTSETLEPI